MQGHHPYHHRRDAIYEYTANRRHHPFVLVLMVMLGYFAPHSDYHVFEQLPFHKMDLVHHIECEMPQQTLFYQT